MVSELRVYNTLSRSMETFTAQEPPQVNMYVCGVTVYDDCHVGHGRAYVVFDVIRRFLEYEGYEVTFVENFTDVEDKIINRAEEHNRDPFDLSEEYTDAYFEVMDRLNIRRADVYPRVTAYIDPIVSFVEGLLDAGYAYEVDGDVYYDVGRFESYGELSGQNPDEMKSGARVEVEEAKRSPLDFALWKSAEGDPSWESPWGPGRPGWHIECSTMAREHLGDTLDIHGGGQDLIFPHHENEIAQAEGLTGEPFSRYWLHNGFVTIDDEKMSKSEGNFYTLKELFDQFDPMVIRYFILTRQYRSPIDFSFQRIREAAEALGRVRDLRQRLRQAEGWRGRRSTEASSEAPSLEAFREAVLEAMRNDFNTARAIGELQNWLTDWNRTLDEWEEQGGLTLDQAREVTRARGWLEEFVEEILGIRLASEDGGGSSRAGEALSGLVETLLTQRQEARERGDYERADELRDLLADHGVEVQDSPDGPSWSLKDE